MFRANTPGSIWATLGTTDWNWFGSAKPVPIGGFGLKRHNSIVHKQ